MVGMSQYRRAALTCAVLSAWLWASPGSLMASSAGPVSEVSAEIPVWTLPADLAQGSAVYDGSWYLESENESTGWSGQGKLSLKLDGSALLEPLQVFLYLQQVGGTIVSIDGHLLGRVGLPGDSREEEQAAMRNEDPLSLWIQPDQTVLLEMQHSNYAGEAWNRIYRNPGRVILRLVAPAQWTREVGTWNVTVRAPLLFFIAVPGMLALLHFSIAGLGGKRGPNLAAGIFMLSLAVLSGTRLILASATTVDSYIVGYRLFMAVIPVFSAFGLRTMYSQFGQPGSRVYRILWWAAWPAMIYGFWAADYVAFQLVAIYGLGCSLESLRIAVRALQQRREGAVLIFVGMAVFALVVGYNALRVFGVIPTEVWSTHSFNFGILILALVFSLNVAREFAVTGKRLAVKLVQVQELHEENLRREREKQTLINSQKERLEIEVTERTRDLRVEKDKSDQLLQNILPAEVAAELKETGESQPRRYEEVTILFSDFSGFTATVSSIPVKRLITELNEIFSAFDDLAKEHGLEKIKTIGDAYMAAAGLPELQPDHAIRAARLARAMLDYTRRRNESSAIKWQMRIGLHSGPVVAGVVGKWKFTYDVFGDTVNLASRMESVADADQVCVSAYTYDLIKYTFGGDYGGKVPIKGKGELDVYRVIYPVNSNSQQS